MPRIRTVKPEFWSHPVMGKQLDEVKTMAISLLNLADDEGYFYSDPANIRSFARPFDDDSTTTLGCLQQLITIEYIAMRQHPVRGFIGHVVSFLEHQRVDKPKPSVIKKFFEQAVAVIVLGIIQESSTTLPAGKEGKGKEQEEEPESKPSARSARGVSNSSQLAKAQCETRHNRCHQLIMGWYRDWAGIECPWNGAEGRQLSSLLKAWPGAHDAELMLCLNNIAHSDCIAPGTRPCEWLAKLPKFIKGPLDQYWKSKQVTDGNSKAQQRERERDAKWAGIVADRNGTHALPESSGDGLRPRLESGTDRPVVESADDGTEIPPARNH